MHKANSKTPQDFVAFTVDFVHLKRHVKISYTFGGKRADVWSHTAAE